MKYLTLKSSLLSALGFVISASVWAQVCPPLAGVFSDKDPFSGDQTVEVSQPAGCKEYSAVYKDSAGKVLKTVSYQTDGVCRPLQNMTGADWEKNFCEAASYEGDALVTELRMNSRPHTRFMIRLDSSGNQLIETINFDSDGKVIRQQPVEVLSRKR